MSHIFDKHRLITQCQTLLTQSILDIADDCKASIEKELEHHIARATSNQANISACEAASNYDKNKHAIAETFCQQLDHSFNQFLDNTLNTHLKEGKPQTNVWSLLDDQILEESIAINTATTEINNENKDKLWQIEQRLSAINGGTIIDDSNNPISPIQFFVALKSALSNGLASTATKNLCYKMLKAVLQQHYPALLNKANAYFISKGVLPDLNYEAHLVQSHEKAISENARSSTSEKHESIEKNTEEEPTKNEDEKSTSSLPLVNTIRGLLKRARNITNDQDVIPIHQTQQAPPEQTSSKQAESSHIPPQQQTSEAAESTRSPQNTPPDDLTVFDASQIIEAVDDVQDSAATAHFFSEQHDDVVLQTPTNIAENSARIYQQLTEVSPNGAIDAKNMYTIDMVGMLFEYILSDEKLPDSVKTLLSHLHTPFLKLAFLDSDFFENEEHKSRMLLDSLAEAGANWVHHDGTSQYDMYNEIKRVVKRAVKEFKNDVNLFAELLMEFNMLKKRVTHMHNLRERNSIEKKQGQEKHEQAKAIARAAIKERIEGRRVPSSIISLLSPWFTYLTFIHLKEGQESQHWSQALQVIDNLIIYCSIKTVKQDSNQLAEGFDKIIEHVKQGLTHVAYNESKTAAILEELEELKHSVLNKQEIKTTTTNKSEETPTKAVAAEPTPEEERMMNYIKLIEPGTWIEYDNKTRHKVNGFSSDAQKYILVDQSSQEVRMITRLEFARDILAEKASLIDGTAKPLFERALERIQQNLDKQVQASAI